ncbi:hypothetical protein DCC26_09950 [Auritidibacter sp. NML120779]|nr:hypothetical protein DCC26_09950 [Auritidibacter sp. NML120779]
MAVHSPPSFHQENRTTSGQYQAHSGHESTPRIQLNRVGDDIPALKHHDKRNDTSRTCRMTDSQFATGHESSRKRQASNRQRENPWAVGPTKMERLTGEVLHPGQ